MKIAIIHCIGTCMFVHTHTHTHTLVVGDTENLKMIYSNAIPYSANISRAINFAYFAVSLQSAKTISAKMNRRL